MHGRDRTKEMKADHICLAVLIAQGVAAACRAQGDRDITMFSEADAAEIAAPTCCIGPGAIPPPSRFAQLTATNVCMVPLNGDIYGVRTNHFIRLGGKDIPVILTREVESHRNAEGDWVCYELRSRTDDVRYSRVFVADKGVLFRLFPHGPGSNYLAWVWSALLNVEEVSSAKEKAIACRDFASGHPGERYTENVGRFLRAVGDISGFDCFNMEIDVLSVERGKRGQLSVQFKSVTGRKYTLVFDGKTCRVLGRNGNEVPLNDFPDSDWPGMAPSERTLPNGVKAMETGTFRGLHVLLSGKGKSGKWRAFTEDGQELPWRDFSEDDWVRHEMPKR